MSRKSRIRLDPLTYLPTIQSFGELGTFLRGSLADEESCTLSDSMSQLALQIESIIARLRVDLSRAAAAPLLIDLLTLLRGHRTVVVDLSLSWRGLYEYAAYLQALNNFRVLVGKWLLDGGVGSTELLFTAEDFELVAWRTLGEGILMIDMYEQGIGRAPQSLSIPGTLQAPQVERAVQWWKKMQP